MASESVGQKWCDHDWPENEDLTGRACGKCGHVFDPILDADPADPLGYYP